MLKSAKRAIAIAKKRSEVLREILPPAAVKGFKKTEKKFFETLAKAKGAKYKSKFDNIYHVALQKTGTQWIFEIFSDPVVFEYSGMAIERFNIPRRKSQTHEIKSLNSSPNKNVILSPFSGTYTNYVKDIPKRDRRNAIFVVVRDPREMVVSWYFSTRDNHLVEDVSMMKVHRKKLKNKKLKEGLKYTIDLFEWKGKFEVMRSWMKKKSMDNIMVIKFEDLVADSFTEFDRLFQFLDIKIPKKQLKSLVENYSFKQLTGREKGQENVSSHMRSGSSKTWQKYLDEDLLDLFNSKAHDIVRGYGYD